MEWIRLTATEAALENGKGKASNDKASNRDQVALLLIRAGSSGVIEGEGEGAPPLFTLTGYIAKDKKSSETVKRLARELQALGFVLTASAYKNIGWQEKWRRGIRAVRVGSILIRPSWSRARSVPGEKLIELDPGMAFGTGSHPTTKLVLRMIAKHLKGRGKEINVLDVGTGSGILAIAAKKLGAKRVVGTDIDYDALKVARSNAKKNRVRITISKKPLATQRGRFDLVMANIISGTLVSLKGELAEKTAPFGRLVLSGILREEAPEVLTEFASIGLEHVRTLHSGEWAALEFFKKDKVFSKKDKAV